MNNAGFYRAPTVVDPFRRRVARTGYPVAETIRLGTPIACVECGVVGGTLHKVSDSPAVYAHDHAPHPPRRSLMTWRRHLGSGRTRVSRKARYQALP